MRLSSKLGALLGALLLTGAGSYALSIGDDDNTGVSPMSDSHSGGGIAAADFHRFTIPYCRSEDGEVELYLEVINDSDQEKEILVEFRYDGGGVAGVASGTVPARNTRGFTTANSGESCWPEYTASACFFRDTTADMEGHCRVYTGPNSGSAKNVTVTATLLCGLGDDNQGNARTQTCIGVFRADDADSDGHIDSRFKGD